MDHPSRIPASVARLRRIVIDNSPEHFAEHRLQTLRASSRAEGDHSLRVALFTGNYNMIRDGVALILNRLVSFLERQGVEVLVLSPTVDRPAFAPQGTLLSVPSIPVPLRPEYRISLALPDACRKRLEAFRPTLFHLSTPDVLGYAARRLGKRWNLPIVATFHTRFDTYLRYYRLGWLEPLVTRYLRHFYADCDQVYVPSESMAQVLRQQGIGGDLRIWSRGVDCKLFDPAKRDMAWRRALGIEDEDIAISFVGRLVREKGLDAFVTAVRELRRRGVRHSVLLVGDGPERHWLSARLNGAIFTGFLEADALARAYASADVFFFPSVTETFGNVTLEAMAAGLPTVCADATGSRSLVLHGATGFLVPPGRGDGYADVLARLATEPVLRHQFGKAARERAQMFDWNAVMYSLLDYYVQALERHASCRHDGRLPFSSAA